MSKEKFKSFIKDVARETAIPATRVGVGAASGAFIGNNVGNGRPEAMIAGGVVGAVAVLGVEVINAGENLAKHIKDKKGK